MQRVDICVDIGNTRLKWGRGTTHIEAIASLPDQNEEWTRLADSWQLRRGEVRWIVASVHPERSDRFINWANSRGDTVLSILENRHVPISSTVDFPESVGIDRLLNAVGAVFLRTDSHPLIVVDAGTAVTVDAIDHEGRFLGGYILPGLRLLADSLNRHTARLPLIDDFHEPERIPGKNTREAIRGGILNLVVGGIERLDTKLTEVTFSGSTPLRLLTGGDAPLLQAALGSGWKMFPELTLEGIRVTAQANS